MARLTQVRRGNSSTEQESEELDYRREQSGEGDEANLEGVHIDYKAGGWQVTLIHDRNGRTVKQTEHFQTYREAYKYCDPGEEEQEQEPVRQSGGAQAGRGGY